MKDEGYKLKVGHLVMLRWILEENTYWLYEVGYGDKEYIRLNHILMDDKYFDFDKGMLNDIRSTWLQHRPLV